MKHWYFERDMSVGPLSDVVTTINVPVVGSAEFVRGSFFMEWGISDMLANLEASIFVKKTVGELLFEGYEDDVMTIGADMNSEAGTTDDYSYGGYDYSGNYYDGDMDMDGGDHLSPRRSCWLRCSCHHCHCPRSRSFCGSKSLLKESSNTSSSIGL